MQAVLRARMALAPKGVRMMGGHSLDHAIGAKQLPRTWRRAAVDQAPPRRTTTANCDAELLFCVRS